MNAEPAQTRSLSAISRLETRLNDPDAWKAALAPKGSGFAGDTRNVLLACRGAPQLQGLVRFNEFSHRVEFTRSALWRSTSRGESWTDEDDVALQAWLQTQGIDIRQRGVVSDCVPLVARDLSVHPVREYFNGLTWDGKPRIETWGIHYLDSTSDAAYLRVICPKFLISAVARILTPGCQVDHVLVLEGCQGIGKSRAARILGRRTDWFTDDLPDIHSKDAALQISGRWIVEIAELAAIRRSEIEGMKAFLTRPMDVFRPPYGRRTLQVPRQNVFIGTTNETQYLRDHTGNRRFWPIRCGHIDLGALTQDCDQLWAEAFQAFKAGTAWHLSGDEIATANQEQRERVLVTELEADICEYLANMTAGGITELSAKQVMIGALHLDPEKSDFTERAGRLGPQVANAMHAAGWEKLRTVGRGSNRRTIYRKPL